MCFCAPEVACGNAGDELPSRVVGHADRGKPGRPHEQPQDLRKTPENRNSSLQRHFPGRIAEQARRAGRAAEAASEAVRAPTFTRLDGGLRGWDADEELMVRSVGSHPKPCP